MHLKVHFPGNSPGGLANLYGMIYSEGISCELHYKHRLFHSFKINYSKSTLKTKAGKTDMNDRTRRLLIILGPIIGAVVLLYFVNMAVDEYTLGVDELRTERRATATAEAGLAITDTTSVTGTTSITDSASLTGTTAVTGTEAVTGEAAITETAPTTETAPITETSETTTTESVTEGAGITGTTEITESAEMTTIEEVTESEAITASEEITAAEEITETEAVTE
jgi:hypothetical protein